MASASHSNSPTSPSLRVYFEAPAEDESRRRIEQQLPFLSDLRSGLEQATGWCADFLESPKSYRQRQSAQSTTVFGQFSVIDLSAEIHSGQRIAPRDPTDRLVQTIDQMIGLIQDDRETLERATSELAPAVPFPFERWLGAGTCGYRRGQLVTWGIDPGERVIMLASELTGSDAIELARTSNALDALFRTQVAHGWTRSLLGDLEREISRRNSETELVSASIIEFDPLVGQLTYTGTGIEPPRMLLDLPSGRWLTVETEYLGPDQILVVAPPSVLEKAAAEPFEVTGTGPEVFDRLCDVFANEPHLLLGRP